MEAAIVSYQRNLEALKGAFQVERAFSGVILTNVLKKLSPILEACRDDAQYQHLYTKCKDEFEAFVTVLDKELSDYDVNWYNGVDDLLEEWRDRKASSMVVLGEIFMQAHADKYRLMEQMLSRTNSLLEAFLVSNEIAL